MMEIISETDFAPPLQTSIFVPNIFVDITEFIEKKMEILKLYDRELGVHPFPRNLENVKALAIYRGSLCNAKFAESFMLLKEVFK